MEQKKTLPNFFKAISCDPRIGLSHICLYVTLLQYFQLQDEIDPVLIKSNEVMRTSKIAGLATYHRCIRELHDFGYIRYIPSYNHRQKSRVFLIEKHHSRN